MTEVEISVRLAVTIYISEVLGSFPLGANEHFYSKSQISIYHRSPARSIHQIIIYPIPINPGSSIMDASGFGLPFPASQVLKELPDGTPKMKFVDMEHLKKEAALQGGRCVRNSALSPFLVVFDLPSTICEQLDDSSELRKTHIFVDLKENTLIAETMKSNDHEVVSRLVDHIFQSKIDQMGLSVVACGSGTVEYGNYRKEPDGSWKPQKEQRAHPRIWPTTVLEVGWSESINKLAIDAQNWLETEGSQIQAAITIKIERTSQKLIFQKWEKTDRRRITRSTRPSAAVTQQAEVWHTDGGTNVSSLLQIPFEKIFDRPRNPNNPSEQDITFTRQDLIKIAEQQWEVQGFIR